MGLVPKQVKADDEVIAYWLKKSRWSQQEFACLFCGINPYVYEHEGRRLLMFEKLQVADAKKQEIKDLMTLINHRLELPRSLTNTSLGWKHVLPELDLSPPDWMASIEQREQIKTQEKTQLPEKPLGKTERDSLLTIIAALCDYSDIEFEGRGAAAKIVTMTQEIGAPLSENTVLRHLNKIPDALKDRMK